MLDHPLKSESALIVVIDPSKVRRAGIARNLREMGFRDVQQEESLVKAFNQRMLQKADWIITPIEQDQALIAFGLLKQHLSQNQTRFPLISLMLRDKDESLVPWLFQLGAFSVHSASDDMAQLKQSFTALLDSARKSDWNSTLISAENCRLYLRRQGDFGSLLTLANALLGLYPDRTDLLVHLAEALMLTGKRPQALFVLARTVPMIMS